MLVTKIMGLASLASFRRRKSSNEEDYDSARGGGDVTVDGGGSVSELSAYTLMMYPGC